MKKASLTSIINLKIALVAFAGNHAHFLKPGSYSFQEFRVKVVLADSGSYRFDHCRFFILGNDSGLVGQNLHLLELNHCQLTGQRAGTGIAIRNADVVVNQCQLENLSLAMAIYQNDPKSAHIQKSRFVNNQTGLYFHNESKAAGMMYPLTILQNNFSGNQTAISLDASGTSSATDLTLKCNRFDIDNSNYAPPFYGLVLGENHRLQYNSIGGNLTQFFPKSPGANIWPIQGSPNRAIFPYPPFQNVEMPNGSVWQSPYILVNQEVVPTWYSVTNNSTNQPIKMYRYLNEFIGRVGSEVEKANVSDRCYTDANDPLTILPGDIHECEEGIPNPTVVVFPTRMALDSASGTTTGISPQENGLENSLGQNIPNPGNSEVLIPYRLKGTFKSAVLEITQLSSGRTFEPIRLSKEETSIILDLSNYPAGVYAYTLRVDSSPVQTRKLVVVR